MRVGQIRGVPVIVFGDQGGLVDRLVLQRVSVGVFIQVGRVKVFGFVGDYGRNFFVAIITMGGHCQVNGVHTICTLYMGYTT